MFTFGKKMNFWPLSLSLGLSVFIGLAFCLLFNFVAPNLILWSLLPAVLFFILMVAVYYPLILQYGYNYCEISQDQIKYYDFSNYWQKVMMVFRGPASPMKAVPMSSVKSAKPYGKEDLTQLPALAADFVFIGLFAGKMATIKNAYGIELELDNGDKLHISTAREKADHHDQGIEKTHEALHLIKHNIAMGQFA
ncbi:MAG: hypothetical protein M3029_03020 [Lactobacillus helsingborgensis]|uniref:hypothetical protein n=1 Tax=Lactobacillus helsingborgensis TaxID=1218494 RepID=UPI00226560BB|nr:hypothetical protein [Lactobacillus helsingborgensis]MCT6812101.1 hypothetical protein [Lactobacillus helsingborgensis]MCT6827651.1 hypothetical protein [Lactobacillus helsingborgensis]UZX31960.1 hypothetical protein LDX52_02655 [Lactobacillus helsingborgensis]